MEMLINDDYLYKLMFLDAQIVDKHDFNYIIWKLHEVYKSWDPNISVGKLKSWLSEVKEPI